ncbi:hypothetical protein [Nonomuraea sediminis]|uniref:hypothetical protein n=1 Tax=Nonomuraea sediminis TaxID=2835864 RepID=UPI001BDC5CA9|nr:hypothetical protein [Nonomuraea sediminis]
MLELPTTVKFAFALTGHPLPDVDPRDLLASGRRLISFADTIDRHNGRADGAAEGVLAANAGDGVTAMHDRLVSQDGTSAQAQDTKQATLLLAAGEVSASVPIAAFIATSVWAGYKLVRWLWSSGKFGAAGWWMAERGIRLIGALLKLLWRLTLNALKWIGRMIFKRAEIKLEKQAAALEKEAAAKAAKEAARPLSETAPKPLPTRWELMQKAMDSPGSKEGRKAQRILDLWDETGRRPDAGP